MIKMILPILHNLKFHLLLSVYIVEIMYKADVELKATKIVSRGWHFTS